ncbi:MAG: hypothetical protein ACM31L_20275 [Actinomycetota bacterium]
MTAALVVVVLGLAAMGGIGLGWGTAALLHGWLAAAIAVHGLAFGGLLLLLVDHVIPQHWSLRVERAAEAAALTMPLVGLAFVPVLAGMAAVWPWASVAAWPEDWPNHAWLAPGFFAGRTVAFFLAWSVLAVLAATRTRKVARPAVAAVGLIVWALSGSLAGFDWQMSLEPPFRSTIFGLLFLEDQTLTAVAFAVLVSAGRQGTRPGPLAAVLLSVVLLWSYLAFMQYLIIWSADLPHEIGFFLRRLDGGWLWLARGLAATLGGAAFLVLLPGYVRHSVPRLRAVAAFVLALRLAETAWLVLPAWPGPALPGVLAFCAGLAALGGLWLLLFRRLVHARP